MGFFDKLLGGGGKTPFVTDAAGLAKEQELLTRFNIESPEGRRFFTKDPSGREVLNIEETPFQMQQRGTREALASSFLSSLGGGDDRFATESKRIGDLTFERGIKRLEPLLEQRRRRTETQLATQGLPIGSEARRDVISELSGSESDLLTELAQSSELAASGEQDRLRRLSGLEAQSFFGGELGGINTGAFSGVGDVNRAGIVQQGDALRQSRAQLEATRQNTQRENAIDLAKSGAQITGFFSDSRIKEDIEYIGKENGHNIYEFKYKGVDGRYKGVMAQEVEKIMPEAVEEVNGIKKVFYDMIGVKMEAVA